MNLKVRNRFWPGSQWFLGRQIGHTPSPHTRQCCDWRAAYYKAPQCNWSRTSGMNLVPGSPTLHRAGSCYATAHLLDSARLRAFCTTSRRGVPRTRFPASAKPRGTWGQISISITITATARSYQCWTVPHPNYLPLVLRLCSLVRERHNLLITDRDSDTPVHCYRL
jgi:hypothetical protein